MPANPTYPLVALKDFEFRGRHYREGESFEAQPLDMLALIYKRKATHATTALVSRYHTAALEPEPPEEHVPVDPPRRRRGRPRGRYRRTDLRADE